MNKQNKKLWKYTVVASAALLLAGSFAWFTTSDTVRNVFDMDTLDVVISEKFDPTVSVLPGATLTKEVGVSNNGSVPVVVRMKFKETLELNEIDAVSGKLKIDYLDPATTPTANQLAVTVSDKVIADKTGNDWTQVASSIDLIIPADIELYSHAIHDDPQQGYEYFAYKPVNKQMVTFDPVTKAFGVAYFTKKDVVEGYHEVDDTDLTTAIGVDFHDKVIWNFGAALKETIADTTANTNEWVYDATTGYYYYASVLQGGQTTAPLLESVEMDLDMPVTMQGAVYTITPEMEAVQAVDDAVDGVWTLPAGSDINTFIKAVIAAQ